MSLLKASQPVGQSPVKVALVASVGGHTTELLALRQAYESHPHFYIFNEEVPFEAAAGAAVYRVVHSERDARVLYNVLEFLRIFRKERPTVMLSTGAGQAVPAAIAARLCGMRVLFVDSVAAVERLSLTGVLMQALSDAMWVQWPHLAKGRDGVECKGSIFGSS
jgi:beta-1,4-N-acetylglucosaminyltransferase